jgi:hypothetical protein
MSEGIQSRWMFGGQSGLMIDKISSTEIILLFLCNLFIVILMINLMKVNVLIN